MRIGLALRLFWAGLWGGPIAERLDRVLRGQEEAPAAPPARGGEPVGPSAERPTVAPKQATGRSDALTLLAALQREARFVDLVKEPLTHYSDEQIGAAARDVLCRCERVLDRFFGLAPLSDSPEGTQVEVPAGYDPYQFQVVGHTAGSGPYRGKIVHPGWKATRCELPVWSGSREAAAVVAPVEVEIQ